MNAIYAKKKKDQELPFFVFVITKNDAKIRALKHLRFLTAA